MVSGPLAVAILPVMLPIHSSSLVDPPWVARSSIPILPPSAVVHTLQRHNLDTFPTPRLAPSFAFKPDKQAPLYFAGVVVVVVVVVVDVELGGPLF